MKFMSSMLKMENIILIANDVAIFFYKLENDSCIINEEREVAMLGKNFNDNS